MGRRKTAQGKSTLPKVTELPDMLEQGTKSGDAHTDLKHEAVIQITSKPA